MSGPRTITMAQAQRAYDNLTPEDVYGPEPEEEDTVVIITDDCVGCGSCLTGIDVKTPVCPKGAISVCNGKADIDQKKCTQCGRCISFCGVGAIVEDKA